MSFIGARHCAHYVKGSSVRSMAVCERHDPFGSSCRFHPPPGYLQQIQQAPRKRGTDGLRIGSARNSYHRNSGEGRRHPRGDR